MPTAPRTGKFPQNVNIAWSNGKAFNGYALIGLIPPAFSGTDAAAVAPQNIFPAQPLPDFAKVPIIEGLYNSNLALYWNQDLHPPNSRYNIRFYDVNNRLISGPSAAFEAFTDPIANTEVITVTLTVPSAGGTAPTPD